LNDHGKAGVVIPHGVLFRGAAEGRIRQNILEEDLLETVIGLPANLFFGTGIPAAIMLFNKEKKNKNKVLFIDASRDFIAAKNQNYLSQDNISHILEVYSNFHDNVVETGVVEDKFAYVADFEEIKNNDFNLNIPRYVDTYEEEAEIDILAVQSEIETLETELAEVQEKMNQYLEFFK
jgi:type I restriction enzyme M protein